MGCKKRSVLNILKAKFCDRYFSGSSFHVPSYNWLKSSSGFTYNTGMQIELEWSSAIPNQFIHSSSILSGLNQSINQYLFFPLCVAWNKTVEPLLETFLEPLVPWELPKPLQYEYLPILGTLYKSWTRFLYVFFNPSTNFQLFCPRKISFIQISQKPSRPFLKKGDRFYQDLQKVIFTQIQKLKNTSTLTYFCIKNVPIIQSLRLSLKLSSFVHIF